MPQSSQDRARHRGVYAAKFWIGMKRICFNCDKRCVAWVMKHKLPSWMGHIPFVMAFLISLVGLLVGGFIFGCIVIIVWAILLLSALLKTYSQEKISNWDKHNKPNYEKFSWENDRFKNTHDKHSWHQDD
jgi:hypothetical protein